MKDRSQIVAQAFVDARRTRSSLAVYPGDRPSSLAAAYAIQDCALSLDGRDPAGWKVGRIGDELAIAMGTNRLAGPIFADSIVTLRGSEVPAMPVFAEGFAAVEAEFLLHVAAGWSGQAPADDAEILDLIDAVHAGIEIASSPYAGINADGPLVTISDFGNNFGLIVGALLGNSATLDFAAIPVALEIDGIEVGAATTATMLDGPLGAARFLLGNLADRGIAAPDGFWISSGAVTGVHVVKPGARVRAVFGALAQIDCTITSA